MKAENARRKCLALLRPPKPITSLVVSEFGTRRRRSFQVHDMVMQGLMDGWNEWKADGGAAGGVGGTSNVCCPCSSSGMELTP